MKITGIKLFALLLFVVALAFVIFSTADRLFETDTTGYLLNQISQENKNEQTDTTPLEISVYEVPEIVLEDFATVLIETNKSITLEPNNRLSLVPAGKRNGSWFYVLEITNLGIGESNVRFNVSDNAGNSEELSVTITKQNFSIPFGDRIDPWPDTNYIIDGDELLANVTKENRLMTGYAPRELVDLNKDMLLYTNVADTLLREDAAERLKQMLESMQNEIDDNVVIASAYRSYNDQLRIYTGYLRADSQENVDTYSARPGYSEHQLGTVVDFINEESGFELTPEFDKTRAGQWLLNNAHKFGFIQSYPKGSEEISGYIYEAWQYRYIGLDNAEAVYESGLSLPEFIAEQT